MEKSVTEKMLEGSLLSKVIDPRYFIMFTAFGLYWDSYSHLVTGEGLLNLTYSVGDAFPLGNTFILIASFSLLASLLSPALFWILFRIFLALWFELPDRFRLGQSNSDWEKQFRNSVPTYDLKLWAIKSNNSLAMSLAKEVELGESEMEKNRPQPFLLALCTCGNYFITQDGLLRTSENALPGEVHGYFVYSLMAFVVFLLYIAFTTPSDHAGYIYLPGLKDHIGKSSRP